MNALNKYTSGIAAFALVWLAPLAVALASPPHGEAEHAAGHAADHGAEHAGGIKWLGDGFLGGPGEDGRTGFLIILINFVVLMLVLNKLLFQNLRRSNAEASDVIRLELERATKARAEAEALVLEYETKLSALESEIVEIRAHAVQSAEAEHARILADAAEQAEKVKVAATRAAEREAARFRAELEREIVDQAMQRAEQAIRASFGGTDQRRLVDAWVEEVSSATIGGAN
ncbi:ATP synthase F0 sector subunit b [Enhygromyxa salina]|uniref:ATP synthase subunit b n=1 Tax=Enhygromyxa salina TaxID=215803 RepID=A0A0C2CWS6_9BACT|nr:ATP synthase F0 subunit B [Enhygromyxa salina]KIG12307.1 ATP synthase F0 sector subunit b [Enhygromyxa salina]